MTARQLSDWLSNLPDWCADYPVYIGGGQVMLPAVGLVVIVPPDGDPVGPSVEIRSAMGYSASPPAGGVFHREG